MSAPEHAFWNTQPVVQRSLATTEVREVEAIDPTAHPDVPLPLPEHLSWCTIDPLNESELDELYKLLYSFYVEDKTAMFRFAYSKDILKWWLTSPGCLREYSIGIRDDRKEKKLVGYISGVVSDYEIRGTNTFCKPMQSIIFLCLDREYRNSKLAPVLIQEITRRSYKNGVFQAVYTAGVKLTPPVQVATYFHRLIDPIKLARIEFARRPKRVSEREYGFAYRLPTLLSTLQTRVRAGMKEDLERLQELYNTYSSRYRLRQLYGADLFKHLFTHKPGVMHVLVMTGAPETPYVDKPIAFLAYYLVETTVLRKEVKKLYPRMCTGYIYQYALADEADIDLKTLFLAALHDMKNHNVDVCTCLNVAGNAEILGPLTFERGDGTLNYHLFNIQWGQLELSDIGVVLI
ncbi:Glycylpeptide N-tetradecanoyltransferase [Giardia muris]|uniref:Glycylpeptide N-tetradecanoyltransferase n=1 Tax=Giardia muris TaxID=5742 RepID=A0A4Z1SRV0_GIAMU|nr:Glycylpeptide N-tetradecanoyltransferase [Giardia muris]|eukprot:TNJ28616.1 Glycylpeptide N-tetradecanoyltransferase [Giardia muris]